MRCEDTDPGCNACQGACTKKATIILTRVDMADEDGTAMCDACAEDAMSAGVFTVDESLTRTL